MYSKNLAFHGGGKCGVMAERGVLLFFHLSEGFVPAKRCVVISSRSLRAKMFSKNCLCFKVGKNGNGVSSVKGKQNESNLPVEFIFVEKAENSPPKKIKQTLGKDDIDTT